jgi:RNA polymerase sigma-70 factor, ECF subfamily
MRDAGDRQQGSDTSRDEMDQVDVRDVLRGRKDAYARLVGRHRRQVSACMCRFTRDEGVLDELVQEALVEAYLSLASYSNRGSFPRWLRRIATRVGYRHWARRDRERRGKRAIAAECAGGLILPKAFCHSEAGEHVLLLMRELSLEDQRVLTLKYFEGCTSREISARTGWSQGVVRVRAHRARKRLRALLEAAARRA